jgi:hypothetical protein
MSLPFGRVSIGARFPKSNSAVVFNLKPEMLAVPCRKFLRIVGLKEDPAYSENMLHRTAIAELDRLLAVFLVPGG